MSNHPNMSYCAMQNTLLAMRQVNNIFSTFACIDDQGTNDDRLSRDEIDALRGLLHECETLLTAVNDVVTGDPDNVQVDVDSILEDLPHYVEQQNLALREIEEV